LVGHVLARASRDGHTLMPADEVGHDLQLYRVADPAAAIRDALAGEEVRAAAGPDGEQLLALERYYLAEQAIADSIHRLAAAAEPIGTVRAKGSRAQGSRAKGNPSQGSQSVPDDGLDAVQRSAVLNALGHGVSVLTGGPGTGKSRTVAAVVRAAELAGRSVALTAPTGRAAKRLAELCDAEAMTIHRLLGAQPRTTGDSGEVDFSAGFARGPDWPLDEDVVVVDEASMLDVELAASLLRACADSTHLMIVGDSAQLPSIGPGQVLADVIAAGKVPVVQLQTLYRQDAGGAIARLATAVRGGELPVVDSPDR
ncbi:MAG: ATP-dependent DNA helicase, partial [Jatrophihabitans sp.]